MVIVVVFFSSFSLFYYSYNNHWTGQYNVKCHNSTLRFKSFLIHKSLELTHRDCHFELLILFTNKKVDINDVLFFYNASEL